LAFVAGPDVGLEAAAGSRKHEAWEKRDLSILEGDLLAEREVTETIEFFDRETKDFTGPEFREIRLEIPHLNFGTIDFLRFNQKENHAFIGDAKFGHWSVPPAKRNLQGWNYVAYVFYSYPRVHRVTVCFYSAKLHSATKHTFYRKSLLRLIRRVRWIVENAQRVLQNPRPEDFTPHPVNCGFCHRVNCPARLQLASTLLTAWSGKPVELPTMNLVKISTEQLGILKRLSNTFKTYIQAVDDEARRRAFDCDDVVPGYEIKEKSGPRLVIGTNAISNAMKVLSEAWSEHYPGTVLPLDEAVRQNVEISVATLEKAASRTAPHGEKIKSQQLISETLQQQKLVTASPIYYLAAIKE
jgi:hypothetical protein